MATENEQIFRIVVDYSTGREKLAQVNEDLKKAQSEVRKLNIAQQELNAGLRKGAVSEEEFRIQAAKNAQQMISATRSTAALSEQKRKATLETKKMAIAETAQKGSITEVQARLIALRMQYRELSGEQLKNKAVGGALLKQIQQLAAQYRQMEMSIGNTGANVGNYPGWSKFQSVVTSAMTSVFMVQRAVSSAIKPFKDFEYQMDKVGAVSGATAVQLAALKKNARELGESTEYTAAQVAELQLAYSRLGFSPDEILEVTQATLDLATATGEDLARSADIAGATLRGFGLEAKEMPRVIDVMTESLNRSALDLNTFAESMKYVAPIAKTAGVSIEQTSAMLGILADRGIRGSQAGTALRRILTEISISGKTVSEALADLNQKGLTVAGAMDEVGRYAMTALTVLVENAPKVDVMTTALEHSSGAAQKAAAIMRDNLKGDADKALSAMQEKAIAFGTTFGGVFRGVIQLFTAMVRNIETVTIAIGAYIVATKGATSITILWRNAKLASAAASKVETAALAECSTATKLLSAVQLLLTGRFKAAAVAMRMFAVAMASTGIGLLVAGVAAAASYFIFFREKTDAAAEAQKRINAAQDEFNRKQQERKDRSSELISTTRDENAAQIERIQAFRELQVRYPDILRNYTLESFLLADIGKIQQQIAQSDANRKLVNDNNNLSESLTRLLKIKEELQWRNNNGGKHYEEYTGISTGKLQEEVDITEREYTRYYRIVQQNQKDLEALQPVEIRIASLDDNIDKLRAQIKEMEDLANKHPWAFQSQFALQSAQADLAAAEAQKNALTATVATARSLKDEMKKLSDEQLEDKKSSGSKEEKEAAKQILKERKAAEAAVNNAKKAAEDRAKAEQEANDMILSIMKDGKDKALALQEKDFKSNLKKANGDAQKEASVKLWNEQRKQEIEAEYNVKSIEEAEKKLEFQISLMKDGSDKELALLEIQYARELRLAEKNGTDVNKVREAYDRKRSKISMDSPDGQQYKSMSMATANYHIELALIEKLDIAQSEKDKKELQALHDYQKALADARKKNIEDQYALGNITIDQYEEQMKVLQKTYADLADFQSGIQSGRVKKDKNGNVKTRGKGKAGTFLQDTLGFSPDETEQLKQQAIDLAMEIGQSIISIQTEISQRKLKNEQKRIDDERDSELKSLELRRTKGLISEKQYNKAVEAANAEADRKREEAEREAFEREKKLNIMGVIMNVATGIIGIWSRTWTPEKLPWAIAQTAFLAASGIAQTAVIASQKYEQGGIIPIGSGDGISMGLLQGPSHAQGGMRVMVNGRPINAEVEGDEVLAVINKRSARRYMPLLSKINSMDGVKFENGGMINTNYPWGWTTPSPAPLPPSTNQSLEHMRAEIAASRRETKSMIEAINSRIDNIKVSVVESDITTTQANVKKVRVRASF